MTQSLGHALARAIAHENQKGELAKAGTQALARLVPVAVRDTSQGRVVGRFLLGLYDGQCYPFDLTDLRALDLVLFEDCLKVLMMDYSPEVEVHERIPEGQAIWKHLVQMWSPSNGGGR